jgi:hypothetical protein
MGMLNMARYVRQGEQDGDTGTGYMYGAGAPPSVKFQAAVGHSKSEDVRRNRLCLAASEPSTSSSDMPYAQQAHSCSHSLASRPSFSLSQFHDTRQPLAGAFRNNSAADGRLGLLSHSTQPAISAA